MFPTTEIQNLRPPQEHPFGIVFIFLLLACIPLIYNIQSLRQELYERDMSRYNQYLLIERRNAEYDRRFHLQYPVKKESVSPETAVRIAVCESQLGRYKRNWEGSGAVGIYQFKPQTWKNCEGDINDNTDQIRCFLKLYPLHPEYWECS